MAAKGRRAVSPKGRTEAERRPREERCCPMFPGTYGTLTQKWPGRACPNRSPAFLEVTVTACVLTGQLCPST